ncbi:claudin-34 [Austrofundulus limnaeus]|uniref:Claudin-34 n=1 Tax=Austrofundulus limnaeus TaxID=52670 RepID=A0A2I4ALV2_AUSLI|nr:PREDICTED: claudin-34-like [Austrofundulus limnaeus]
MMHLAHTAHWQFLGLISGFLAWIIIMATAGLNEWRVWHVADVSIITSGEAWVGIWRACFFSHVLPRAENCRSLGISDPFVPVEIPVAQVLMIVAVISGLVGNICAAVAMRMAYFSVEDRHNFRMVFVMAGVFYLLTATFMLVPLVWNMTSVLNNSTIDFPQEFHFPAAPIRQRVGSAIGTGLFASTLMLISAVLFLSYRFVWEAPEKTRDPLSGPWPVTTLTKTSDMSKEDGQGMNNPAFNTEETS